MKRIIVFLIIIVILLLITFVPLSLFTVSGKEYVIVTQFGKTVRICTEPGLYFKLPGFLQKVNRIDRRVHIFNTQIIQLLLGDKNPIVLSCFVCWKVDDPLLFFQSLLNHENAKQKLEDMINSQLGNVLGDYSLNQIINTTKPIKLDEIEAKIAENANTKSRDKYGIKILKVGLRYLAYPQIVSDAVYKRMKAERQKEAKKYRAEGYERATKIEAETDREVAQIISDAKRRAEIIRGEGDKEAIRIYADAYSKNEDFFRFIKSLELYKNIFKSNSTLVLSTRSELFKYLNFRGEDLNKGD